MSTIFKTCLCAHITLRLCISIIAWGKGKEVGHNKRISVKFFYKCNLIFKIFFTSAILGKNPVMLNLAMRILGKRCNRESISNKNRLYTGLPLKEAWTSWLTSLMQDLKWIIFSFLNLFLFSWSIRRYWRVMFSTYSLQLK